MTTEFLLSGFGGQGLMSLGKLIARAAIEENKHTTWFPSYGAEMRGGTAHCYVKISETPIASPFIRQADIGIFLNQPSLDRFSKRIKKGGILICNIDLCERIPECRGIRIIKAPLNQIALACGNIKVANTIALGIMLSLDPGILGLQTVQAVIKDLFPASKKNILQQNLCALKKGGEFVQD
ncbi:MAG: 2-oxoacid:acceptor oxidoreductase family protein [Candidatus Omnitrophica bacterium]|nr:2-oxoacid:acceptor oxidoreductase family protein [Candidatus Omnitrophota bacterium]